MTSNLSKSVLLVTKGGVISVDEDVCLVVKVSQYELTLPCVSFNINDLKSVVTKGGVISVDEDVRLVVKVGQYELTLPCMSFNANDLKSVVMKLRLKGEVELTSDSYRNTFIKSLDGCHSNTTFYMINAIFYI
jgi:hypothetical protein